MGREELVNLSLENMNRLELLAHKNLIEEIELHYYQVECDDVSFL